MSNWELSIPPVRRSHHAKTGQFLKGHVPFNKGKKWDEYLPKRTQKRISKGWKNLDKYRPTSRPDNAGRCRKPVIAVMDDGKWCVLPYIGAAGQWVGGNRENVRRCCKLNQQHGKNTDHRYMGVRFYFESDNIWIEKIKESEK